MDELLIVDRTERTQHTSSGKHVITPGAALYGHRWRTYHITDKARNLVMSHPAYRTWFKQMLCRIDNP